MKFFNRKRTHGAPRPIPVPRPRDVNKGWSCSLFGSGKPCDRPENKVCYLCPSGIPDFWPLIEPDAVGTIRSKITEEPKVFDFYSTDISGGYTKRLREDGFPLWKIIYVENRDFLSAGAIVFRGLLLAIHVPTFHIKHETFEWVVKTQGPISLNDEWAARQEGAFSRLKVKIKAHEELMHAGKA